MQVGQLRAGEGGVRSLGRRAKTRWRLGKIARRKVVGLSLKGQNHIRKGIVFHGRGLFVVFRKR